MTVYLTKDSTGLIQLWKNKPRRTNDECGGYIWFSHSEIGIEVNNVLWEYMRDYDTNTVVPVNLP